jgi:hypothetical protein
MSLSRPPPASSKQITHKSGGNTAERGGLGQAWDWGVGGMGDQVPILQYLNISITYSYTAGKVANKTNF